MSKLTRSFENLSYVLRRKFISLPKAAPAKETCEETFGLAKKVSCLVDHVFNDILEVTAGAQRDPQTDIKAFWASDSGCSGL